MRYAFLLLLVGCLPTNDVTRVVKRVSAPVGIDDGCYALFTDGTLSYRLAYCTLQPGDSLRMPR